HRTGRARLTHPALGPGLRPSPTKDSRGAAWRPFASKASAVSLPPLPLRLLPAGAKVAGWDLHPLKSAALARRTRGHSRFRTEPWVSPLSSSLDFTGPDGDLLVDQFAELLAEPVQDPGLDFADRGGRHAQLSGDVDRGAAFDDG